MHIQLKNVRVNEGLSRESLAFTATLYINGLRVGRITNDGNGGETNYEPLDSRGASIIKEAVKWVGSFAPKLGSDDVDNRDLEPDRSKFGFHLEDAATGWWNGREAARFHKKAEKAMENGILFGVPGQAYRVMKYRQSIATIIELKKGVEQLKQDIHTKVMPLLNESEKILNTNIPREIIGLLAVPDGKWVDQPGGK
ncbi:MAG TPA: hypothetical protein VKQ52_12675 [Puia sp.]|nr:hypothetical protein [Puia sp.]